MNKKLIRLTESDIHRIVKESVQRILNEVDDWDAHLQQDDDLPDNVIFDDDELSIENEARFLPHLKRTYENLRREYEHWQYANYKPQGMDNAISAIIEAMHSVEDVIKGIEPSDNIPTWEDPQ